MSTIEVHTIQPNSAHPADIKIKTAGSERIEFTNTQINVSSKINSTTLTLTPTLKANTVNIAKVLTANVSGTNILTAQGPITAPKVTANTINATAANFTTLQADAIDFDGDITVDGITANTVVANGGVTVDNITIDGTEIDLSSGNLTVDSAGSITLDCGDGELLFNNAGNGNLLKIQGDSSNVNLITIVQDKDLVFKGNDGGSTITALTLDMSDAGTASFNHDIKLGDNGKAIFGAGGDLEIYHDASDSIIADVGTGNLQIRADDFYVMKQDGSEVMIRADTDSFVKLYHNNTERLATTSVGIGADQIFGLSDTDTGIALGVNAGDVMQFYAGNAERARIMSDGLDFRNTTGTHYVLFKDGDGVHFGSTQGSNTTSSVLDDYEEGTWTPICGTAGVSGTYSVQLGRYVKIGRLVHVIFNLTISSAYTGSTSSSFQIGGLPYATNGYDASLYAGGHIGYVFNINFTDTINTVVYQIPSGSATTMELKGVGDNLGEQAITPAMFGSSGVIRGSITYHAA